MSDGVDRRTFLRRAGLVATGAAATGGVLAACSGKSPTTTFDSVIDHPAKESGIDTVVVLTMENRSFDHMLGWLATDEEYLDAARRRHGAQRSASTAARTCATATRGPDVPDVAAHHQPARARPVARLHPPDPRPRLEQRPRAARRRLPRCRDRQRRVRDRLLRRRRRPVHPGARAALHRLRPLARPADGGDVPEPPVPAQRDVRRPQGGPDPAAGRHLRGTDDLGPPHRRRRPGALLPRRSPDHLAVGPAHGPYRSPIDDYFTDAAAGRSRAS